MKKIVICLLGVVISVYSAGQVGAWSSSNRYGGSTTHTYGSTSHTNAYGGSSSHAYGEGTSHTNMYGGSTSHGWYGGTSHTNVYGGTTSGAYGAGVSHTYPSGATAYHPPAYGTYPVAHPAYPVYPYHPPVAVPYYSASGCYGCAAAAGAVVGMATGVAIATASTAAATTTAYNAGVVAGSVAATTYVMGTNYAVLPSGCASPNVGGTTYFLCGNTWFQPFHGANGVYYLVVPTP
jgi:hypothetical protein